MRGKTHPPAAWTGAKSDPPHRRREDYCRRLQAFLGPHNLLCLPTTPALAPVKGTLKADARGQRSQAAYYPRTLSLTSIAGIGLLPQVTLPPGNAAGRARGPVAVGRLRSGCLLTGGGQPGG